MDWPDLRDNVRAYLCGDNMMVGQAEWVVYRRFLKGMLTPNWSPTTDEAIGGTKFKYIEFLVRYLKAPIGGVFGTVADTHNTQGWIPDKGQVAILEWNMDNRIGPKYLRPQERDIIMRIRGGNARKPPQPPFKIWEKYEITAVGESAGDHGRPEAWLIHLENAAHKN